MIGQIIRLILPRQQQFFKQLDALAIKLVETSEAFLKFADSPASGFAQLSFQIRLKEHEADEIAHSLYLELDRTFVTPIDREDIAHLTKALDNVVDSIEHAAAFIVNYHTQALSDPMKKIIHITHRAAMQIGEVVPKLREFHRPEFLTPYLVQVNTLENEADEIYRKAIGDIFANPPDPVDLIRQRDLLNILEDGVDRCEDVLDVIQSVVVKNG